MPAAASVPPEYAAEIIAILSATYESVSGYVAPWKLPFLGLAVWLAVKWFKEAEAS